MDDMTEKTNTNSQNNAPQMQSLYYVEILLRWKNFIILNTVIVAIVISGITLLMPNWYKATASILPPKQQDIFGSAIGTNPILRGLAGSRSLSSFGRVTGGYNYLAILKSRTTMEDVINKFDLMNVYDISDRNMDKAVRALEGNTLFETQDDDNITIDVYDKDPQRAADMANYFVEILNSTSIQLGTQEARNNREFIGRRLEQCRQDLRRAEDTLKTFQEKKDIIIAEYANNTSISAYAELYAMKAKKEIEVAVLEKKVSRENQLLLQLKAELRELSKKLSTFPQTGLEGVRLYRDVITQEKILEFLLPIYEQAKIDEQKDVPVLLVLDKAVPPQRKAKPQRTPIVALVSFLGLTFSILIVFFFNAIEKTDGVNTLLTEKLKARINKTAILYRIRKTNKILVQ
jgi:tyrosine-protein kinase Etk/Wzc